MRDSNPNTEPSDLKDSFDFDAESLESVRAAQKEFKFLYAEIQTATDPVVMEQFEEMAIELFKYRETLRRLRVQAGLL